MTATEKQLQFDLRRPIDEQAMEQEFLEKEQYIRDVTDAGIVLGGLVVSALFPAVAVAVTWL